MSTNSNFIPQAIVNERAKVVLHVFRNKQTFNDYWKGTVSTIDAPGIETHPFDIKLGDIIADNIVGWNCFKVGYIKFTPDDLDKVGLHRVGYYSFATYDGGTLFNIRIDGRAVLDRPYYIFPADFKDPFPAPIHPSKP